MERDWELGVNIEKSMYVDVETKEVIKVMKINKDMRQKKTLAK
jgi:hypothetical protein